MENRFDLKNRQLGSPNLEAQKRMLQSNQISSPKFARKRLDIPNFLAKKIEKKQEQGEILTFISPKKYLQNQQIGNESVKSINSVTSFNLSQKPRESYSNYIQNHTHTIISPPLNANIKQIQTKQVEKLQQTVKRVSVNPQFDELRNKNFHMEKKIHQLTQKTKSLKQENIYLFKKVEDFTEVIKQKNQIINNLSQLLKNKDIDLNYSQNQLHFLKKKNQQLENIIFLLNKSLQEGHKCTCSNLVDETDDSDRQNYQKQIQKYKTQIQQLIARVKYSQMQSSMYQKLRYDLSYQIQRNETLKNQNKKLIARVQYLSSPKSATERSQRLNILNKSRRNLKESQISLQLTPEKQLY